MAPPPTTRSGPGARAASPGSFYGWRIVLLAALTLGLTAPGQTPGVSVFIDPMMAALDLSRAQISTGYLVGTLAGAATMPWFGRLLDRRGLRWTVGALSAAFTVALAGMSLVGGLVTVTIGFVGIRMLGKGALSLTATTAAAYWFDRRRGLALGTTSAVGSALISSFPPLLTLVLGRVGWRGTWLVAAAIVGGALLLLVRPRLVDRPGDLGQTVDGHTEPESGEPGEPDRPERMEPQGLSDDVTRRQAARTVSLWAITAAVALADLAVTALAFHQVSVLGAQGLSPLEAAANFLPQTGAALAATFATGALVDHVNPRALVPASMALMAGAFVMLPVVEAGWTAPVYAAMLGAAGGSARSLESAGLPALFGTGHLGAIRGMVMTIKVSGAAVGPVLLSLGRDALGSYVPVLRWGLVLPAGVAALALVASVVDRDAPALAGRGG